MSLAEVIPTINKLTRKQKIRLVRRLIKELNIEDEILPTHSRKVHYLYTPYNMYGVARLLKESKESGSQMKA